MPQFMTPEMLTYKDDGCAHDTTIPEVFQDCGDSVHRACWTLASECKKCGDVFIYGTDFGLFDDRKKENRDDKDS